MSSARVSRFAGAVAFLGVALLALVACGGSRDFSANDGGASGSNAAPSADLPPAEGGQPDAAAAERKVVINSSLSLEVEKLP